MIRKIKNKLKNRFMKAWLIIFIAVIAIFIARVLFLNQNAPSLAEVLARTHAKSPLDISAFIISLLAFSLAALSLAKGYEIFKRNRTITDVVLPEEKVEISNDIKNDEKDSMIEKLKKDIEELKRSEEGILEENLRIRNQMKQNIAEHEMIKQFEQALRKSNISLSKECERLKSENEQFMLKVNSIRINPKPKRPTARKRTRVKKRKTK